MNPRFLIVFTLLSAVVRVDSIECVPNICDLVDCANVSLESCKGPNKVITKGDCGCCDICFTYLDEGESCPSTKLMNPSTPTAGCKLDLICEDGKCKRKCE